MQSDYYETLIHKYLSGELSTEEQKELETWLEQPGNRRQLEEAERIWTLTETAGSELDIDLDHEIFRFKQRIDQARPTKKMTPIYSTTFFRYAAAAAVVLSGIILLLRYSVGGNETIVHETAETTRVVVLPDLSKVWLNENSRLAYNPEFNARSVELSGEAFFEVTHNMDRPFDITSGPGYVQVLGTSFSVRNKPDEDFMEVTVATGKVALSKAGNDQREELVAGYKGILDKTNNRLSQAPNTNPEFLAWRSRQLAFDNTLFNDVVESLREHFAILIAPPDAALASCTFTGQFDSPALSEVLESLTFSLNIDASIDQGVYAFSGTGCP